jgi:hypothetical protein
MLLRTVDIEKLIDEDHSARSLWEVVGQLGLSRLHAHHREERIRAIYGTAHHDPQAHAGQAATG